MRGARADARTLGARAAEELLAQGAEPNPGSPEELRRYLDRQIETWGKVIREANIKAE